MRSTDAVIIVVYLVGVVAAAVASRGRQEDADDYFTAGGGMGGLLTSTMVGLSIAATLFSGISFLMYPSVVYTSGLVLPVGAAVVCMPLAWVLLHYWFLPRYLATGSRQPYDVLEQRFGTATRLVAAGMYVLVRTGWMAALIYAPTLAILSATGLGPEWFWPIILVTGLSSTIYTVFCGIRGVIVTDAIQFLVIAVGITLTVGVVLWRLPVPLTEAWAGLAETGRLRWLDLSPSLTTPLTFWSVAIGVTVANLGNYLADQMSLQRYLATGSVRAASRSFAINVVGVILIIFLLAGVGLALAAWYAHVPDAGLPAAADRIFPYFIATQLPVGVTGLLLAAILAASMSSMTSGINALAATITLDFRARIGRPLTGERQLRFARIVSLAAGVFATLVAGLVHHLGTLFELAQIILGVFLGPLLVCVMLAVTSWTIRGSAMVVGLLGGCVVGWGLAFSPLSPLWVAPAAAAVTLVGAVGVSALLGVVSPTAAESASAASEALPGEA